MVYLKDLKWSTIVQKISETYLITEAFGHIGFEAKQEMKPYCTQNLSGGHFEKVEKDFFQDGGTHVSDNTEQ